MKLRSGFGQPMLFCLAAAGVSLAIPLVIAMVFIAIGLVLSVALGGGGPSRAVPNIHSISPGLAAAAVIGYTALYFLTNGVVHPLLRAGFHHFTLLMVQGAKERFEATYRATAYTTATLLAVMMPLVLVTIIVTVIITPLTMLPLLPILIILVVIGLVVMDIIWHTIALRESHGSGGGRAAGAVLLALVIHVVVSGVVSVGIQTLVANLTPLRG